VVRPADSRRAQCEEAPRPLRRKSLCIHRGLDLRELTSIMAVNCDHAVMAFSTRIEAGLIQHRQHIIYPTLTGADHESRRSSKENHAFFAFDDPELQSDSRKHSPMQ
jgi:hypothetical protein